MPTNSYRIVSPGFVIGASLLMIGLLGGCGSLATTQIASPTTPSATPQEIAGLFDRWNASLQTGNPDEVVRNYRTDAILLPTVSNKVRHNHAEIRDYFVHFLEIKPRGTINERNIRLFGDTVIDSGIYTFNGVKQGKPIEVKARYTFVYRKEGDTWLIAEHHSSGMPEPTN